MPSTAQMIQRGSAFPKMSGEEAAALIPDGAMIGFSGFTPAGAAKAVPRAMAQRSRAQAEAGHPPLRYRVLTGASTGSSFDDVLAEANAVAWRAPYQSSRSLRKRINSQETQFLDMHLSHVPQALEFGVIPKLDFAVVEAVDVTPDGRVYLSTSSGISPSALRHADRVIIELNRHHSVRLAEMHDVAILPTPPHRSPISIHHPLSKIGTPFAAVDPVRTPPSHSRQPRHARRPMSPKVHCQSEARFRPPFSHEALCSGIG